MSGTRLSEATAGAAAARPRTSGRASAPPGTWLDEYIHRVVEIPQLSHQEEKRQVRLLHGEAHAMAVRILVLSHLRFVVNVARDYLRYGQPFQDLIQEGNVGLIKAVNCFSPKGGERLLSFAIYWINAEISGFVLDNWRIADSLISKEQRRLFVRMRRFKRGTARLTPLEVRAAATYLRVRPEDIVRLEERLGNGDIPFIAGAAGVRHRDLLDSGTGGDGDDISGVEDAQWSQRRINRMLQALTALDDRARDIVSRRWLNAGRKMRLHDLAHEYHVSGERIRQIQDQAFETLRDLVR
jgi:RNA polymerase sigma-32 factor